MNLEDLQGLRDKVKSPFKKAEVQKAVDNLFLPPKQGKKKKKKDKKRKFSPLY
jgi:hypothetical protein